MDKVLAIPKKPKAPPIKIDDLRRALERATEPAEIIDIGARLDAFESYMHDCGLYSIEDMRPINEARMLARWKLGQALAKVERGAGPGRGKKKDHDEPSFLAFLAQIDLNKKLAITAQRIGTLPEKKLRSTFDEWRGRGELLHYNDLILIARPYWYRASREKKHRAIREAAVDQMLLDHPGPFPLIYADPPFQFEIYGESGTDRTPDQHYPTLADDEIKAFLIDGKPVQEIAYKDAVLFLWCTSSNLHRALGVMAAWGFEFKSSAVWVKTASDEALGRFGLGLARETGRTFMR